MNYKKILGTQLKHFRSKGFARKFTPVYRYTESFPFSKIEFDRTENKKPDLYSGTMIWCTNDYLNMSHNKDVIKAMVNVIESVGTGSGGTRNISGTTPYHEDLEKKLASFHQKQSALIFTSAYVANQTTLSTLLKKIDGIHVFSDELNHASLIEGIKNSRAHCSIFKHNNLEHLDELLSSCQISKPKIIVFESLYSMDGTETNVAEYVELAKKYNALTYLDEVHAVGLYGHGGRGVAFKNGVSDKIDIINGTLAKGFGQIGGYIVADQDMIDFIRTFAPGFIFTTSMMPSVAAAAKRSIEIVEKQEKLRNDILNKATYFRNKLLEIGVPFIDSDSHIIPLLVYSSDDAKSYSKTLLEKYNSYIQPIFYPTVPKGSARLRITITPKHSYGDIDYLISVLDKIWKNKIIKIRESNYQHA